MSMCVCFITTKNSKQTNTLFRRRELMDPWTDKEFFALCPTGPRHGRTRGMSHRVSSYTVQHATRDGKIPLDPGFAGQRIHARVQRQRAQPPQTPGVSEAAVVRSGEQKQRHNALWTSCCSLIVGTRSGPASAERRAAEWLICSLPPSVWGGGRCYALSC